MFLALWPTFWLTTTWSSSFFFSCSQRSAARLEFLNWNNNEITQDNYSGLQEIFFNWINFFNSSEKKDAYEMLIKTWRNCFCKGRGNFTEKTGMSGSACACSDVKVRFGFQIRDTATFLVAEVVVYVKLIYTLDDPRE